MTKRDGFSPQTQSARSTQHATGKSTWAPSDAAQPQGVQHLKYHSIYSFYFTHIILIKAVT